MRLPLPLHQHKTLQPSPSPAAPSAGGAPQEMLIRRFLLGDACQKMLLTSPIPMHVEPTAPKPMCFLLLPQLARTPIPICVPPNSQLSQGCLPELQLVNLPPSPPRCTSPPVLTQLGWESSAADPAPGFLDRTTACSLSGAQPGTAIQEPDLFGLLLHWRQCLS